MTTRGKRGADYRALTREQAAALAEFDRALNAASDSEALSLVVPPVLGARRGGGLRLRGCSASQLEELLALKRAQEWVLGHDADAARAYLGTRRHPGGKKEG